MTRKHPELHHYTTLQGLRGIISSNSLWSTSYLALNDTTEVRHACDYLAECMQPIIDEFLRKARRSNPRLDRLISLRGGTRGYGRDVATRFISAYFGHCISEQTEITEPMITSFCSHQGDSDYEKENGLLSQWRAYGSADGAAIVFDTWELGRWSLQEAQRHYFRYMAFEEVIYNQGYQHFQSSFAALVDGLRVFSIEVMEHEMRGQRALLSEELQANFLRCSCVFKHQAFREEREVRLVSCPITEDGIRSNEFEGMLPKRILLRGSNQVRYIELQSHGVSLRDCINRIIIGPSKEQGRIRHEVAAMLGDGTPVVCSKTPLLR